MRHIALARVCLPFLTLATLPMVAWSVVFTPGQHAVTDSGSAAYSIPIVVPPGAAGVQPKVALQYNSRGGDGILGVGMSIQGLSSVSRCPKTRAQDGAVGGVRNDNNDRLCLDGRRLMVISGSYGADGAEYRFEQDDFSRIIGRGDMSSSSSWFEVTQRDGVIRQYGASSDSRIEAQGTSTIANWALYRTQDTSGNYLEWRYTKYSDTGDWYPASILYTGRVANGSGGAMSPFAEVRFLTYGGSDAGEVRPDQVPMYKAGSKVQLTRRIRKIQTYAEGALVREYRLDYDQSPNSRRSRITQLTECAADGQCLLPTRFEWASSEAPNYAWASVGSRDDGYNDYSSYAYASIDHRGLGRYAYFATKQNFETYEISPGTNSISKLTLPSFNGFTGGAQLGDEETANNSIFTVDINGDGRQDVYFRAKGAICISYGEDFSCSRFVMEDDSNKEFFFADVNADGRTDMVLRNEDGTLAVWYSNGTTFVDPQELVQDPSRPGWAIVTHSNEDVGTFNITIMTMDYNGDGLPDLVSFVGEYSYGGAVIYGWPGTGSGFGARVQLGVGVGRYSQPRVFRADINGDGLMDIVNKWDNVQAPEILLSTGKGFVSYSSPGWECTAANGCYMEFADVNGDGRDDFIFFKKYDSTGNVYVWLSTGTALELKLIASVGVNQNSPLNLTIADMDGDGRADVVARAYNESHTVNAWRLSDAWPDVVRTVVDGTGQRVIFDYESLSYVNAGNFYEKDAIPSYPLVSLQHPSLVVKAVTETNVEPGRCWSIGPLSKCSAAVSRTEPNPTTRSTRYRYGGLRADILSGRGSQGFRWIEATQEQTGIVTTTEYEQDFPLTGQSRSVTQRASGYGNGGLLKLVSNSNTSIALGNGRYFSYLAQSTENSWELNGTAWPSKTLVNTYDCTSSASCYGNLVQTTSSASDGYGETRNITYRNDTGTNILGLPVRVEITRTAP